MVASHISCSELCQEHVEHTAGQGGVLSLRRAGADAELRAWGSLNAFRRLLQVPLMDSQPPPSS